VADEDARAYVAELGRWSRVAAPPPHRAWRWWLGGAFAFAAAALLLLLLGRRGGDPAQPMRIGERVAVVAATGARYRVVAADAAHTQILVENGTLTARLFPGAAPHELLLVGGDVRARAVGTIYSLTVTKAGGAVNVHEGTVRVEHGGKTEVVVAGATWPAGAPHHAFAGDLLVALAPLPAAERPDASVASPAMPDVQPVSADAGVADAAGAGDASSRLVDAQTTAAPPNATATAEPSITDRWRRARLRRGQGDFAGAIADCLAIADAHDATWSPIALLEAARIELGPRSSPERAIVLTERIEREWGAHQLAPEGRALRCRALRQLGRGAECGDAP
jgi:hypothetical protein